MPAGDYVPHNKITMSGVLGTLANPQEIWSLGFSTANLDGSAPAAFGPGDLDALVTSVPGLILAPFAGTPDCVFATRLKAAPIGSDGKYTGIPIEAGLSVVGTNSSAPHPWQVTLSIGLQGPPALRRARGRFYLPPTTLAITSTTGVLSSGLQTSIAGDMATALQAINDDLNALDVPQGICIAQSKGIKPGGVPANVIATEFRVGRVLDTQRRRRNDLDEAYVTGLAR